MTVATITGTAKWAHLQKPNTKFEPVYSIDVTVTKAQATALKKAGLNVKTDKESGEPFIAIKRRVAKRDGTQADAPEVWYKGKPFDGLVGNGSNVTVKFMMNEWTQFGKKGIAAYLLEVKVNELVEYGGKDEEVSFDDPGSAAASFDKADDFDDDIPF